MVSINAPTLRRIVLGDHLTSTDAPTLKLVVVGNHFDFHQCSFTLLKFYFTTDYCRRSLRVNSPSTLTIVLVGNALAFTSLLA